MGVQLSRGGVTIPPALLFRILDCRTLNRFSCFGFVYNTHDDLSVETQDLASPRAVADGNGRVSHYIK